MRQTDEMRGPSAGWARYAKGQRRGEEKCRDDAQEVKGSWHVMSAMGDLSGQVTIIQLLV